jgi:hypothetical protein
MPRSPSREDLLPIPAEWRKLPVAELLTLAGRIAERDVKDKASAIKVVEAEIDMREKANAPPPPRDGDGKQADGGETKPPSGETKPPSGETKPPSGEPKQPGGDGA